MAHFINDDCIKCGACAGACPTACIKEGEKTYVVNESECVDCGTCEAECPTGAIQMK